MGGPCRGLCDPSRPVGSFGPRTARLPPNTWSFADGKDATCVRCHVALYDVPPDMRDCPCCHCALRRRTWPDDGRPTWRTARHAVISTRRRLERHAAYGERTCGICGAPITGSHGRRKYCSDTCRWKAGRTPARPPPLQEPPAAPHAV